MEWVYSVAVGIIKGSFALLCCYCARSGINFRCAGRWQVEPHFQYLRGEHERRGGEAARPLENRRAAANRAAARTPQPAHLAG